VDISEKCAILSVFIVNMCVNLSCFFIVIAGMLTRPAWHEAKAKESENEAEAKKLFRGQGHDA